MPRTYLKVLTLILVLGVTIFLGLQSGNYLGEKERLRKKKEFSKSITAQMKLLNIGDTLPNYKFEVIGGDSVWLKDLLSKKCVLTLVLPECQDCLYEAQQLKAAISDSNDARFFIFATWDNPRTFEEMKNENGLTSLFLYDHKRSYFSNYDINTFPFNISLNEHGVVLDLLSGAMWKDDFREVIDFNKAPSPTRN